ncbi:MAG TPA: hypothetical protein VK489_05750 [Ferruginibacter sp.]|nr:hypothetical protein [Ferruginibacter sp.]
MKKNTPNTDKDKLNPLKDTSNYAAGREGEDILENEDQETEDDPLADELVLSQDGFIDEEEEEDDDNDDDDDAQRA